jgi:5-methylcytosine-specific restriction enzyme A
MRWQRVRKRQLAREPLCRACDAEGHNVPASEADHIKRIKVGGEIWSPGNLQSLCSAHHKIKTQQFDLQGKDKRWETRGCDEHGNPRDPSHPWNQT